ncbi:ScbR family autoregulator-binding transcription factor [Curtobacterium caseinilyticum]|uniref:ScbR family autoregulator-binding transcription factor n=1 Tax=Curtobacterium caseinilyticum TaxID=3055137 RepID=A0ABT7TSX8_9MICO|nr:ScbR family autoregulator-binding transcription factor [Curtobacterium caseinilyticum]MDM7892620.1 ScbR family autoregulator-binding transcription factor [Curtobacterium caseinilyticum]
MAQDGRIRQERAVATRAALIAAAAAEFDERGYLGASMDGVAERAGMTKGALYFHFRSKADTASAVIAEQDAISRRYAEVAATRSSSPLESLMWMTQGIASQMTREVVVRAGLRLAADPNAREIPRDHPYEHWVEHTADIIRRAIATGEVDPSWDPELIGRVVSPAVAGVQMVSDMLHDRADLYERLQELWTMLLSGIASERTRAEVPRLVAIIRPEAPDGA